MNNETSVKAPAKTKPSHLWRLGESGNPKGTKRGSRHRATLLAENLYKGECEEVRKVIELGLAGDVAALKIAMDRLLPPIKSRPITFKVPELRTVSDALRAISLIIEGVTAGEVLADEAQSLTEIVGIFIKALEVSELEDRLTALEQASAGRFNA